MRHTWVGTALAVFCVAALGGCGSGSSGAPATTPASSADVAFADCMRAHGVSNFPDPLPTGGFPRGAADDSPAARAARRSCFHILRPGLGGRHAPSSSELAAAVRYARCVRAHGVPSFPDPVTSLANRNVNVIDDAGILFPVGSSIDIQSPAFQHAEEACGGQPGGGRPKGG